MGVEASDGLVLGFLLGRFFLLGAPMKAAIFRRLFLFFHSRLGFARLAEIDDVACHGSTAQWV